jgi:hypothetical protein
MVDFTGSGLRIADADCGCGLRIRIADADCGCGLRMRITDADCEPMQIVYFFGKKATIIACSYAMHPRKWLYMSWL